MHSSYNSQSTKPLYHGTQIVWYVLGFIEILLAFRFILKLLGANDGAGFSRLVYEVSHLFVSPFINVFSTTQVQGSVFEWATVLAMIVYWVIALGIIRLLHMGKSVSTPEAAAKLADQEDAL